MKLLLLTILLSSSYVFYGQELEIKTEVSSDSILLGNHFILEISLNENDAEIVTPIWEGMQLISGPNVSMSMQMINGDTTVKKSFSYYLKPEDVGQYYIEPIEIKFKDQLWFTEPLEINVYHNPKEIIQNPNMSKENFFNFELPAFPFEKQMEKEKKDTTSSKRKLKRI